MLLLRAPSRNDEVSLCGGCVGGWDVSALGSRALSYQAFTSSYNDATCIFAEQMGILYAPPAVWMESWWCSDHLLSAGALYGAVQTRTTNSRWRLFWSASALALTKTRSSRLSRRCKVSIVSSAESESGADQI